MFVIIHKKIFLIIAGILVTLSLGGLFLFGFRSSIDFTGGSLIEVAYDSVGENADIFSPELADVVAVVESLVGVGVSSVKSGESSDTESFVIHTPVLNESTHGDLLTMLSFDEKAVFSIERDTTIGPIIGAELKRKAFLSITLVAICIILFIAYTFRHVSKPLASWKYGIVAIITLIHDMALPTGLFVLLGKVAGVEVDILFVTALLATLGYSVNDTIVVFDRIRENLRKNQDDHTQEDFAHTVGKSLQQTYVRSINTSLTTMCALLALLILGGESTRYFSLALLAGVLAGTYSSIFLASPLLVFWEKKQR